MRIIMGSLNNHATEKSIFYPRGVEKDEYNFAISNFTVILNWTQEDNVHYNITIDPLTDLIPLTNTHNKWKVTGNYNTRYNLSVEATLCNMYSKTTNIFLEYS